MREHPYKMKTPPEMFQKAIEALNKEAESPKVQELLAQKADEVRKQMDAWRSARGKTG